MWSTYEKVAPHNGTTLRAPPTIGSFGGAKHLRWSDEQTTRIDERDIVAPANIGGRWIFHTG